MVLLICALSGVAVWLVVRRRRRLAQQTARPFTVGGEASVPQLAAPTPPQERRPSFINIMPVTAVLTAAVSPSVASSFQTRAPPPPTAPHRRGSLYSAASGSIRSNPFSDGRGAAASTSDVSTLAGARTPRAVSRQGSLARPPSQASTVRSALPAPSEHPFSPDFRPSPALVNPVVLRVRTSMQPRPYTPSSAGTTTPTPRAQTSSATATTPRAKEKESVPEERDVTDPPPSYTPRSGLSAFALSPSGHARSASASTWDSRDDF